MTHSPKVTALMRKIKKALVDSADKGDGSILDMLYIAEEKIETILKKALEAETLATEEDNLLLAFENDLRDRGFNSYDPKEYVAFKNGVVYGKSTHSRDGITVTEDEWARIEGALVVAEHRLDLSLTHNTVTGALDLMRNIEKRNKL